MAAEHVFYDQNTTGVTGDVQAATSKAALMAGIWAMGPEPVSFKQGMGRVQEGEARERVMDQLEQLGLKIMNRMSLAGGMSADPINAILSDPDKRRTTAHLLGQAYIAAYVTMMQNREQVERIADVLVERGEMHGDEVVELLEDVGIRRPRIDYLDEGTWPKI
jgi:ATP-dependent Zn protease